MFPIERYDSIAEIAKVTCPILMLHGTHDTIVPYAMGRRLFEAAPRTSAESTLKSFVDLRHSDHNDVLDADGDVLQEALTRFVQNVERREPGENQLGNN
jgi:hypothetical protein